MHAASGRGFVPIEEVLPQRPAAASVPAEVDGAGRSDVPFIPLEPIAGWEGRTSLFGEPER